MLNVISENSCDHLYELVDLMWSGGKENMEALIDACDRGVTTEEDVMQCLENYCTDDRGNVNETVLNDFVWFEIDTIIDYLGITEEELYDTEEDTEEEEEE